MLVLNPMLRSDRGPKPAPARSSLSQRLRSAGTRSIPLFARTLSLILAAWIFPSCWTSPSSSPSSSTSQAKLPQDLIRIQLTGEPITLDPALAEDGLSLRILNNVMEGLVGYRNDGKLELRMASQFWIENKGKRFRFKIREGVKWENGEPVQASDFVRGLRRSLGPQTHSKLSEVFRPIQRNAQGELTGVYEKDQELIIELTEPLPSFIQILTLPPAFPYRESQEHKRLLRNGPYVIQAHQLSDHYLLAKNPHYWRDVKTRQLRLQIVTDTSTGIHLFESNRMDIVSRVPGLDLKRFENHPDKGTLHEDPMLAVYYLTFNVKKKPFDDPLWRRAVSASIQRSEILTALGSREKPALSFLPPGLEGYFPYTPVASRTEFQASVAQIQKRPPPPKATLSFNADDRNQIIMEKIQSDLKKTLHLSVELVNFDWKAYVSQMRTEPSEIFRFAWLAPFYDPLPLLQVFTTHNPNNLSKFSHPQYDRWVQKIAQLPPGKTRQQLIEKANRLLVFEEAIVVPIYHYVQLHLTHPSLGGFGVNPFSVSEWRKLYRKP